MLETKVNSASMIAVFLFLSVNVKDMFCEPFSIEHTHDNNVHCSHQHPRVDQVSYFIDYPMPIDKLL